MTLHLRSAATGWSSRRRWLLAALMVVTIGGGWFAGFGGAVKAQAPVQLAVLAPASGNITTLLCYEGPAFGPCVPDGPDADSLGGPHAGTWSARIDYGNVTGESVWYQIDYLPNDVSGGYLIAYESPTACSSYAPSSSSYNGKRIQVDVTFYDPNAQLLNGHSMLYQHIDPDYNIVGTSGQSATWQHWNNYFAPTKLWLSWIQDFTLNNVYNDGAGLAVVSNLSGKTPPAGCATASHLHMENAAGNYNSSDYIGNAVTERWSDAQYMYLAGID